MNRTNYAIDDSTPEHSRLRSRLAERLDQREEALARIAKLLAEGRKSASEIATLLGVHQTAASGYLHYMSRELRLVRNSRKRDRQRRELWELGEDPTLPTLDELHERSLARRCVFVQAEQIGMRRDSLVHALFGPGPASVQLPY